MWLRTFVAVVARYLVKCPLRGGFEVTELMLLVLMHKAVSVEASEAGGFSVLAPVTNRGEAIGVLELSLEEEPSSVVLADIGRPEQDGYALIEAIRALPSSEAIVPAVAVTAYVSSRDRAQNWCTFSS